MRDEKLESLFQNLGVLMADAVCEGIDDHEARRHPPRPTGSAEAAPGFPTETEQPGRPSEDCIPGPVLDLMLRLLYGLRSRDFAILVLARIFDYPEEVVLRELAAYETAQLESDDGLAHA